MKLEVLPVRNPAAPRSTSTRKSRHCWLVIVQKPTHPSAAGSIDGISTVRPYAADAPPKLAITVVNGAIERWTASSTERSTCWPRPVRRAPATAASAPIAA